MFQLNWIETRLVQPYRDGNFVGDLGEEGEKIHECQREVKLADDSVSTDEQVAAGITGLAKVTRELRQMLESWRLLMAVEKGYFKF